MLDEQVQKMITKNFFQELSAEEIRELSSIPHHCVHFNWVHNSTSLSTPFRMVSNTSAESNHTTLSTEQMAPSNVLNSQENVIVRFQLFPIPLCGDIAGAHHTIRVDGGGTWCPETMCPKTMCPEIICPGDNPPRKTICPGDNMPRRPNAPKTICPGDNPPRRQPAPRQYASKTMCPRDNVPRR